MTDTKERIVETSAELFRRQGFAGTGVKQIVTEAGAPFASLYHFFPGGKQELGAETIRWSGAVYAQLLDAIFDPAPDVATATRNFFDAAGETLRETDYADACPIAAVALEVASTNEHLRKATADVFESWIEAVSARFRAAGIPRKRSRELAILVLTALEGAFVLARASKDTQALSVAGAAAAAAVEAALEG